MPIWQIYVNFSLGFVVGDRTGAGEVMVDHAGAGYVEGGCGGADNLVGETRPQPSGKSCFLVVLLTVLITLHLCCRGFYSQSRYRTINS